MVFTMPLSRYRQQPKWRREFVAIVRQLRQVPRLIGQRHQVHKRLRNEVTILQVTRPLAQGGICWLKEVFAGSRRYLLAQGGICWLKEVLAGDREHQGDEPVEAQRERTKTCRMLSTECDYGCQYVDVGEFVGR
ncbi:hypothetical protein BAUCODRAFT_538872 [Baudoinia panamericana UAMH 10762]|uniref:Uncharacterized protein n=1 Tax=Baudoinia panamericana (strain UAMH 10762) TaxID=717646 RepID=M2N8E2_BAUPA|nr:uncharacterized protein BAUCODRAFT_538872 [Baudoinia panamericana UAMH 10762]EMC95369.1 hypothetical protein BAUCODRAFT_538872 [Baudoinia panamericana UAMH 10762]